MSGRAPRPQAEDYFRVTRWRARGLMGATCQDFPGIHLVSLDFLNFRARPISEWNRFSDTLGETSLGLHPRHDLSYGFDYELTTTKADAPASIAVDRGRDLQPWERQVARNLNAGRRPVKRRICAGVSL
jgi:hypothetical protein